MLSTDPNRIVVKRTVLSGYPLKVNKKSAVIRFMFHNREDVLWFKPVELQTKYGRRGHIKEPLGKLSFNLARNLFKYLLVIFNIYSEKFNLNET